MENRGLLFIPDISGFSQFVNAVELEHSRFIIQQLLEVRSSVAERYNSFTRAVSV